VVLLDPDARPIIGHRGAAGECPENTILSFQQAVAQDADGLELDVRISADGVPVVIHDATVDRTTDGRGEVRALPVCDLERLDAGNGQHVPRLLEVLETFPDTALIVEVKERAAAAPVADLLRRCSAVGRVLVGSFEMAALGPFPAAEFARAAARTQVAVFWGLSRVGLAARARGYAAFAVPVRHGSLAVVDRRFISAARRRGKPLHVWTVNDSSVAKRLRSLGVSGIITDYPGRIRRALSS
jgi:glycerophosphoryl diester phosphodiesterase